MGLVQRASIMADAKDEAIHKLLEAREAARHALNSTQFVVSGLATSASDGSSSTSTGLSGVQSSGS